MIETPLRVLFVEDSVVDVELGVRALEREGFGVSWDVVDAESDLRQALAANRPQIVLSDFAIPGFDGNAALRIVRELTPSLPFIFVSGTIGEERAIEALHLGATDYVLKHNLRRLGPAVRRALSEAADRERTRAAEDARQRLADILEATSDYVVMIDPGGKMTYVNAAGRNLLGVAENHLWGRVVSDFYPAWARDLFEREALPTAIRTGLWQGETALLAQDGREIAISQVLIGHRKPDGTINYFSTIARDIGERKAYEARIQHLANYDALTDLPNRSLLADRVSQALTHARRSGRSLALLIIGVDRFKLVNDGYGRPTGDAVLGIVADRLQATVRDGDSVARIGGDEFGVLAADLARPDDVLVIARKIQNAIHSQLVVEGRELHVTVTIGASIYPRDGYDFDTLLRAGGTAMHRVKSHGPGGFQFHAAAMSSEAAERVALESALRLALPRGELELHYQPQIGLASNRIIGFEALMRWNCPGRGQVPPVAFIPIAEESDLIELLGDWALSTGCRQMQEWDLLGPAGLRLAVNVSARQFRSRGFVEAVGAALHEAKFEPSRLELELTESVLVEDQEEAISTLTRLKALGVNIAIDDFGTGYSSLSYLSRLPIDCLKIDRSFVHRMAEDRHDVAIVQAVVSLARSLGLRVIAEGIETVEQLEFLRSLGCEEGQGYLFSRPLSAEASTPLIMRRSLTVDS